MLTVENHINSLKEGLQQHSDTLIERIKETCKVDNHIVKREGFNSSLSLFSLDKLI